MLEFIFSFIGKGISFTVGIHIHYIWNHVLLIFKWWLDQYVSKNNEFNENNFAYFIKTADIILRIFFTEKKIIRIF